MPFARSEMLALTPVPKAIGAALGAPKTKSIALMLACALASTALGLFAMRTPKLHEPTARRILDVVPARGQSLSSANRIASLGHSERADALMDAYYSVDCLFEYPLALVPACMCRTAVTVATRRPHSARPARHACAE
jgi:hypothetical protein